MLSEIITLTRIYNIFARITKTGTVLKKIDIQF